jgi:hypothetical protein
VKKKRKKAPSFTFWSSLFSLVNSLNFLFRLIYYCTPSIFIFTYKLYSITYRLHIIWHNEMDQRYSRADSFKCGTQRQYGGSTTRYNKIANLITIQWTRAEQELFVQCCCAGTLTCLHFRIYLFGLNFP